MKHFFTGLAIATVCTANAQDSTKSETPQPVVNPLQFSGYVEGYYSYDFNKPGNNSKPAFLYNYNRNNEFNLNLGFVRGTYAADRVRGTVAIGIGTYMNANYAAEPGTLKNIYEANIGYKLSAKRNLWLDIGVLPSHIGFESATGKDNWALTRSLIAENSPYFEGGARLTYITNDGKLTVAALALNGWQRITRVDGNSLLSYGTQILYKPSAAVTLNYSTFIGTDKPDSARLWRYFHDVYGIFQLTPKLGLTAGFDIGTEEKNTTGKGTNTWYGWSGILRFTPTDKYAVAVRGEYYDDENGVIIATGTLNGFKTSGVSLNLDYLPQSNVALRLEGRVFNSKDDIFLKNSKATGSNTAITFSTAISF